MTERVSMSGLRRLLICLVWIVGISCIIGVGYFSYVEWKGLMHNRLFQYDYGFFYYAFHVSLQHQPAWQLYDTNAQQAFLAHYNFPFDPHNQFVYPPQFAVFWSLFGALPFRLSAYLWMTMSAVCYGLGVFWIVRILWPRMRRSIVSVLIILLVVMTPVQVDIGVGNVNSVLFAAIALTFYLLYRHQRPWLAGIPLGLAIVFKVTPAAILVYLLLRKQWRTSSSAFLTAVVVSLLTASWLGGHSLMLYAKDFFSFGHMSMKNGSAPYNQSLIGVLGLFVKHHWLQWPSQLQHLAFYAFAVIVFSVIVYIIRRTPSTWPLDIALACLTPLLFSPLVEEAHMVFVLPTILVLTKYAVASFRQRISPPFASGSVLILVTVVAVVTLSLPMTFCLNFITRHWPQFFWVQTQMFCVLYLLFATTIWCFCNKRVNTIV